MLLDKRWLLIDVLINNTRRSKLAWEQGPTSNMYYTTIDGIGISLNYKNNDYILALYNQNGEIVETVSDVNFSESGFSDAYEKMQAAYDLAKATATGSEKIVDELLKKLGEM